MNKKDLDFIQKKAEEAEIQDDICCRSTLYGLSCYYDFIPKEVISASLNLAGGVGASSGSCGAFCGAQLAIGLKFNPEKGENDPVKVQAAQIKMMKFRDKFIEEFGTTLCPEIHKQLFGKSYDFKDDKQTQEFFEISDHAEKCAGVVGKAARIAAEFIEEESNDN